MNDLISRQAAIDAIDRAKTVSSENNEIFVAKINAQMNIEQLPSAHPEPTTEIQEILNYLDTTLHPIVSPNNWNVYAELHDMVSKLSSAQPEQRWIPCSERMPDVAQRVLLSGHGMVMVGMLHGFSKYSLEPTGMSYIYPKDSIEAWTPLPEPYEGGSTDE